MAKNILINHHQFSLNSPERDRLWEERRRHFKDYCVNRYQWSNYPKWAHVADFPLHVDLEASFRCNLECPMCFRPHLANQEHGDMDFELFSHAIKECADHDLYSIRVSWRGECTLNPRLTDMIAFAKEAGIKEVSFITNGSRITEEFSRELVRTGLDYVAISVDGLEHHYNRIRTPLTYREITEKITALYRIKEEGGGFPLVKIQGIWPCIEEDPAGFYDHFEPITDNISFDALHDYSETYVEQDDDFTCQYPWQRISVAYDGTVPSCISDWDAANILGTLQTQSIRDIWLGKAMQDLRHSHVSGTRMQHNPACRRCQRPSTPQIGHIPEGRRGSA
jgi:radical SAM protein with 4Fe4S-binding SPASM domain